MVILRRAFREQLKVYLDSKCISTLLTKKLLFLCKHELSHNSYIVEARKLSLVEKNKTKQNMNTRDKTFTRWLPRQHYLFPVQADWMQNKFPKQMYSGLLSHTSLIHSDRSHSPPIHNLSTTTTLKPSYCSCQMAWHEEWENKQFLSLFDIYLINISNIFI